MGNRELQKLRARRELQEKRAQEITENLARALGVSADELDQVEYLIVPQRDGDGTILGFIIYFWDGATPEFLAKVSGLVNGRWVRIGPIL
ncbi:MAG TPA: hypothetical protein VFK19_06800 [Sphingomicrobium sp.]|nr:hypothetical protein [Sphingomicrobium sp.]